MIVGHLTGLSLSSTSTQTPSARGLVLGHPVPASGFVSSMMKDLTG